MKHSSTLRPLTALAILAALATGSLQIAKAEDGIRQGKTEITASGLYLTGDADIFGGGLGVGYNFSDHWNLTVEGFGGSIEGDFHAFDTHVKTKGTAFGGLASLEYNILKQRFTPFVTAGVGAFAFDIDGSNDEVSVSGTDSGFAYGGGGGFRYDVSDHFMLKVSYRIFGTTSAGTDLLHGIVASLGYKI